jgi:hypothetical protein
LPGTGTWPLSGTALIYEWDITSEQYNRGVAAIQDAVSKPPNYSPTMQCTSKALDVARTVGVDVPSGVSTATFSYLGIELWRGDVANPYALNEALQKSGKQGQAVNASRWPASRPTGDSNQAQVPSQQPTEGRSKKED